MAWGAKKTEHAGGKKGAGSFYGRKADAKRSSSRRRRQNSKSIINAELRRRKN
jgi:hypothetical protein